jgi:hypothetical protein
LERCLCCFCDFDMNWLDEKNALEHKKKSYKLAQHQLDSNKFSSSSFNSSQIKLYSSQTSGTLACYEKDYDRIISANKVQNGNLIALFSRIPQIFDARPAKSYTRISLSSSIFTRSQMLTENEGIGTEDNWRANHEPKPHPHSILYNGLDKDISLYHGTVELWCCTWS